MENHWIGKPPPFPIFLWPEPLMMANFGSILEAPHPGLSLIFIELLAQRHFHQSTLRAGYTLSHTGAPWKELQRHSSPKAWAGKQECVGNTLPGHRQAPIWRLSENDIRWGQQIPAERSWPIFLEKIARLNVQWLCTKQASRIFTYFISFNSSIIPIVQMKTLRLREAQ